MREKAKLAMQQRWAEVYLCVWFSWAQSHIKHTKLVHTAEICPNRQCPRDLRTEMRSNVNNNYNNNNKNNSYHLRVLTMFRPYAKHLIHVGSFNFYNSPIGRYYWYLHFRWKVGSANWWSSQVTCNKSRRRFKPTCAWLQGVCYFIQFTFQLRQKWWPILCQVQWLLSVTTPHLQIEWWNSHG